MLLRCTYRLCTRTCSATTRSFIVSFPFQPFSVLNKKSLQATRDDVVSRRSLTTTDQTTNDDQLSTATATTLLSPLHRTHLIFGSNTDVGKTLVAAGLVRASLNLSTATSCPQQKSQQQPFVHYVKPLQCGGSDAGFVRKHASTSIGSSKDGDRDDPPEAALRISTLFAWETPASPHLASRIENAPVSDQQVITALRQSLNEHSRQQWDATVQWIETAGGVLSPSSAAPENGTTTGAQTNAAIIDRNKDWGWTLQGDLYAQCCLYAPVVLVGDGRLGGISSTLTAYEALVQRGYDVAAIVILDDPTTTSVVVGDGGGSSAISGSSNAEAMQEYIARQRQQQLSGSLPRIVSLPAIPPDPTVPLDEWFASETNESFAQLNQYLASRWQGQVSDWRELAQHGSKASSVLWLDEPQVPIVDSSHSSSVSVLQSDPLRLVEWNTGGTSLAPQTYAKRHGRFGANHLSTCSSTCVPISAIHLAQHLVSSPMIAKPNSDSTTVGSDVEALDGRKPESPDHRVLFTAGAASALEAAIRMGIRTYQYRMGLSTAEERDALQWIVATQEDAWYGGDTLGLLSAAENYVERDHPWFQPRAVCLVPPRMGYRNGKLTVTLPEGMQPLQNDEADGLVEFDSTAKALDTSMRSLTKLFSLYKELIEMQWLVKEHSSGLKIASVLLEPLLQFETMQWIDPLWQRAMMEVAASRNIPVIFDESRVGSYRLGHASVQMIVGKKPDITVFSGSGGSMGAVVATNEVFDACKDQAFSSHMNGSACQAELDSLLSLERLYRPQPKRSRFVFNEMTLKVVSELETAAEVFGFGSIISIRLKETNDGTAAEDEAAAAVERLRTRDGVFVQQSGDCVFVDVSPGRQAVDQERFIQLLTSELG